LKVENTNDFSRIKPPYLWSINCGLLPTSKKSQSVLSPFVESRKSKTDYFRKNPPFPNNGPKTLRFSSFESLRTDEIGALLGTTFALMCINGEGKEYHD
jgi:hypothetical protein